MRVLFLTHRLPYAPNRGDRIRAYHILRALVTYTGACVLVVEILATRILAPHFGSSLFTLSSVLGVTLGALSIGYYAGGILADRNPLTSRGTADEAPSLPRQAKSP